MVRERAPSRLRFIALAMLCSVLVARVASGGVVLELPAEYLTGEHSITLTNVNAGVVGTGSWASGFSITSTFEYDPVLNMFLYSYDITGNMKEISHFIIEVSPDIELDELVGLPEGFAGPETYSPSDPSNPGLPTDIFGFKIDLEGDEDFTSYSFSFYSTRKPMFGSFYAKDGKDGKDGNGTIEVYAYNAGLAMDPAPYAEYEWATLAGLNLFTYNPDTSSVVVPLPAGVLLGAMGMGCLGLRRLRRRKV